MEKIKIKDLTKNTFSKIDLFVCSSSFEDRCYAICSNLDKDKIQKSVILKYETVIANTESNFNILNAELKDKDVIVKNLLYNSPVKNCDTFIEILEQCKENESVLIDITTLTRENILILFKLIKERFQNINIKFCYTPSNKYAIDIKPNIDDLKSTWMSRGVNEIRSILGYPGEFSPLKKTLLIVLIGFEYERAQILIDNYEPDMLFIGRAQKEDSISDELSEINKEIFNFIKINNPDALFFDFSCKDFGLTKQNLTKIISKHIENYNIIISPMNNKISTIATGIVAIDNPKVQICYATTNQYNTDHYSADTEDIYLIESYDFKQ